MLLRRGSADTKCNRILAKQCPDLELGDTG